MRCTFLLISLLGLSACSNQTTLHLRNGGRVTGEIQRRDGDAVIVVVDGEREVPVSVHQVESAELPGTARLVTGGVFTGLGAAALLGGLMALGTAPDDSDNTLGPGDGLLHQLIGINTLAQSGLLLGIGIPVFASGSGARREAREALEPPRPTEPEVSLTPSGLQVRW